MRRRDAFNPEEPEVTANWVDFLYGDCTADRTDTPGDTGCGLPFQVQVWPACERNPSVYSADMEREALTVRGVPAYLYEEGTQLEVSTGRVTVILFGNDRTQLLEAANRLTPVNAVAWNLEYKASESASATVERYWYRTFVAHDPPQLPEPVAGALEGALRC